MVSAVEMRTSFNGYGNCEEKLGHHRTTSGRGFAHTNPNKHQF